MSEIAMTEKPDIQPMETFVGVERDYFRHATPLTGPGLGAGFFPFLSSPGLLPL
jgi:hypothetical protein